VKSHGKKWADKMKSDLKDIARSKMEAKKIKRNSVVLKRNLGKKELRTKKCRHNSSLSISIIY
jgi:hypothetical protein